MSEQHDVLLRMLECFQSGDYAAGTAFLHDDLVVDEPPGLPHGGVWRGKDASATIRDIVVTTWEERVSPLRVWDAEDAVFTYRDCTWTSRRTGRTCASSRIERFEFADGKIWRIDVYIKDVIGLAATLDPETPGRGRGMTLGGRPGTRRSCAWGTWTTRS